MAMVMGVVCSFIGIDNGSGVLQCYDRLWHCCNALGWTTSIY